MNLQPAAAKLMCQDHLVHRLQKTGTEGSVDFERGINDDFGDLVFSQRRLSFAGSAGFARSIEQGADEVSDRQLEARGGYSLHLTAETECAPAAFGVRV